MSEQRLSSRALIHLLGEWRGPAPAYRQLADAIRVLALDRRVVPGTILPAERDLAARLGVSRTTVAAAYRSLREGGTIESLRGSGSVLRAAPIAPLPFAAAGTTGGTELIDLHQASPAAWAGLAELYAEVIDELPELVTRPGYDLVGRASLREAIAQRYRREGIPTTAEQIVITNGAQSALALVVDVLARRGDRSAVETPTYPHAAEVLRHAGTRPVSIPVDPVDGWDMDRAEHVLRRLAPTVAYLMPDFQNPTGASMPQGDRESVVRAAAETGTTIIVDGTTGELAIDPVPSIPPLGAGADHHALRQIVSIGSMSKSVWGGLRIGWIRADDDLISRIIAARPRHDLGTSDVEQALAERAWNRMPEILADRSRTLRSGRDRLVEGLRARIPEWDVPSPPGGVALWIGLNAPLSSPLSLAARERGLIISSGPRFGVDGGHERHLRIPFTAAPPVLDEAVDKLALAWEDVRARGWIRESALPAVV